MDFYVKEFSLVSKKLPEFDYKGVPLLTRGDWMMIMASLYIWALHIGDDSCVTQERVDRISDEHVDEEEEG